MLSYQLIGIHIKAIQFKSQPLTTSWLQILLPSILMVRASSAAATTTMTAVGMTTASGVAFPLLAMLMLMFRRSASLHVPGRALIAPVNSSGTKGGKAANIPKFEKYHLLM